MPDLAILVPTRGRPGNIQKVISAWDFTNAWDSADLVIIADADDPEIQGYWDVTVPKDLSEEGHLVRLIEMSTWMPMVHKLDVVAREMAGRYWALGFAGDDHLPQTINWAARYLTVLRELGTGMVYGDDGYQGANLSTEWAITSDAIRALGRMVPAPVEHMYCDNSVLELFTEAGAVRHLPEVRIEHMHPYAGKADSDDQYKRVNGQDQMNRDRRAYQVWKRSEMAAQVAAIRAMRPEQPEPPSARRSSRTARRQGRTAMKPPRFFKRVQAATPDDVMMALADLAVQVPRDQEIVEIGVFHGRTALQLAWGARQGNGAHVTGIDLWDFPGNTYGPPFTEASSRRWAYHHVKTLGYSRDITLVQGFSHEVAAEWSGSPVGLLFVDGDHSKDGALLDIETWARHLAPDARIAVDDYGHPDWPGVKEAVDELVAEGVLEPIELFHDHLAVTRLAVETPEQSAPIVDANLPAMGSEGLTAITSEGISPPPGLRRLADVDDEMSTIQDLGRRMVVSSGELEDVAEGTGITDLKTVQLRALAKKRGIVLGYRVQKRDSMIQALTEGK